MANKFKDRHEGGATASQCPCSAQLASALTPRRLWSKVGINLNKQRIICRSWARFLQSKLFIASQVFVCLLT
jgi:hypothetical protein